MIYIPDKIKRHLTTDITETDDIGCSKALVRRFGDLYLKQLETTPYFTREHAVIEWLQGRLPVPKIIEWYNENGIDYLLMTKAEGEMSCSEKYLADPENTVKLLADGLKMLWNVDISDCPFDSTVDAMLDQAEIAVREGNVDVDDWDDDTDFESPEALLKFLRETKPADDPVFSHGDYCMPNIFIKDKKISGFIDLGDAGISDRWNDISICTCTMKRNFHTDKYTPLLFEYLGMEQDPDRMLWWKLFDELC